MDAASFNPNAPSSTRISPDQKASETNPSGRNKNYMPVTPQDKHGGVSSIEASVRKRKVSTVETPRQAINNQSQPSETFQANELVSLAFSSNDPDVMDAVGKCRNNWKDHSSPLSAKYGFTSLTQEEQLSHLRQKIGHQQTTAKAPDIPDIKSFHAFDPIRNLFGTPVQYALFINKQEQYLTPEQQLRLANAVLLDEVANQLGGTQKPDHGSKWIGDLDRTDITLQIEVQKEGEIDHWLLPVHLVNPKRKSTRKKTDKSTAPKKTPEQKELDLTSKLDKTIPGATTILQDALRQDALNPVYVFITDAAGITPDASTQTYSVRITAVNKNEFKVQSTAQFSKYTKPANRKRYAGKTHIQVESHFKRDNGKFVPVWLSVDVKLEKMNLKHLTLQSELKYAKSTEALSRSRTDTVHPSKLRHARSTETLGKPNINTHMTPNLMRRQTSQQKLSVISFKNQLYATNMNEAELKHQLTIKAAINDHKKSLDKARQFWEELPEVSSMSAACPLIQTTNQLSRLGTHAPTPEFFQTKRACFVDSELSIGTATEQSEQTYKTQWMKKAEELSTAQFAPMYESATNELPKLALKKEEKKTQFGELSTDLHNMKEAMLNLATQAKKVKRAFSNHEITQNELLSQLLKIKLESSNHLKKLRGPSCEFSTKSIEYGFYNRESRAVEKYTDAVQSLEKLKALVMLEEKKVGLSVMLATMEAANTESEHLVDYDDYAKFINQMAAYDPNDTLTPLVFYMLDNTGEFHDFRLFDDNGDFVSSKQLTKAVTKKALTKVRELKDKDIPANVLEEVRLIFTLDTYKATSKEMLQHDTFEKVISLVDKDPYNYIPKVAELMSLATSRRELALATGRQKLTAV